MAIEVVDGDEDEDNVIQKRGAGLGDDDVAEQREARILAVHLAGVDGVLDEKNGAPRGVNGGRIEDTVFGRDDDFQVAALAGFAEVLDADLAGRGGGDALQVGHGRGVIGGGAIVGDFGGGAPVGSDWAESSRHARK